MAAWTRPTNAPAQRMPHGWGRHRAGQRNRLNRLRAAGLSRPCQVGEAVGLGVTLLLAAAMPAVQAAPWKDCAFDDRPIPCRDSHFADGSLSIVWQDGPAMTYRLIKPGFPVSILRDSLGGRWEREVLPQGNAVLFNPANGHRIVVPLR